MISFPIQNVQQKDSRSCTLACLSMVTGIRQDDIIQIIQHNIIDHNMIERFLVQNFIKPEQVQGYSITPGFVYIVDVPSLQQKAMLHKIIIDTRSGIFSIHDPIYGTGGEDYQTLFREGMLERIPFGNAIRLVDYSEKKYEPLQ